MSNNRPNKNPVSVSTLVRNAKYWAQKRDQYLREAEQAVSAGLETQAEVLYLDAEACNTNALLCRTCFIHEIRFRMERNRELAPSCQFKIPAWDDLEVYDPGE